MTRGRRFWLAAGLLVGVVAHAGCAEDGGDEACDHRLADGACVGVSAPEICSERFCVAGADCLQTYFVADGAGAGDGSRARPFGAMQEAAQLAAAGDCVALAAGRYGPGSFAGGVSVLGKGAAEVTIAAGAGDHALAFTGGEGGLVRGVTLSGEGRGVLFDAVVDARLVETRIDGPRTVGVELRNSAVVAVERVQLVGVRATAGGEFGVGLFAGAGARARVERSVVQQSAGEGVLAADAALELDRVAVIDSGRFGVALTCAGVEPCSSPGSRLTAVEISRSAGVGLWARGGALRLEGCDVGHTALAAGVARNIEVSGAAQLEVVASVVHHSEGQGIVLDDVGGAITSSAARDNEGRGVWIQRSVESEQLTVSGVDLTNNGMVGLGALKATGLVVDGGRIVDTRARAVLVGAGAESVGDGLQLVRSTGVKLARVEVLDNPRVGVLAEDTTVTLEDCTIGGSEVLVGSQGGEAAQAYDMRGSNVTAEGSPLQVEQLESPMHAFRTPLELVASLPIPLP